MRVELSAEKVKRKKAQKSAEVLVKSPKYEKDWDIIVERLIQALKDENKHVRWGAAGALGELGDARAVQPLIEALNDKYGTVREYAAKALGEIGDGKAVEPLTQVLKDQEREVREKAADALEKIGWKPQNDTEKSHYLLGKRKWNN